MTTQENMKPTRKTAIIVGILFITATIASILGYQVILQPILNAPDYLSNISGNETQFVLGVLIDSINTIAVVVIAVMLFPILKKYNEALALGYVGFRILESVILIIGSIGLLTLLSLSQDYSQATSPDTFYYQTLGDLLLAVNGWTYLLGPMIVLSLTALILNYILYQSRPVPRFISVWGLVGAFLMLAAGLLGMFGLSPFSTIAILLIAPLAMNEMVLAVWLIVKGFNSTAIASESAKEK